jgi:predicted metal-dependent hydrolase
MKKGDRIEAYVKSLSTGSTHDPCYEGYFVCFNEQQYYEAHDVLEHLWLGATGPPYQFFKGLIQLAGAFVHLQKQYRRPEHPTDQKRLHPACRLFRLAYMNLEPFSPWYLDLDVRSVLELCSTNILQLEEAQFQFNPWNPSAAPTLSLRNTGRTAPGDFRDCLTDEPQ